MKFISVIILFTLFSQNCFAEKSSLQSCSATLLNHILKLEQVEDSVQMSFEELNSFKYSDLESSNGEKFKVSGKVKSLMMINSINLSDLMNMPRSIMNLLVGIMIERREYEEEKDMVGTYAYDFVKALSCHE